MSTPTSQVVAFIIAEKAMARGKAWSAVAAMAYVEAYVAARHVGVLSLASTCARWLLLQVIVPIREILRVALCENEMHAVGADTEDSRVSLSVSLRVVSALRSSPCTPVTQVVYTG